MEVLEGEAGGAPAAQGPNHQSQPHRFGKAGGYSGAGHPHPGEAEEAVDQNGVARYVQEVHHHGDRYHLFEEGIAPQYGAQLNVKPLDQHRPAHDAGVEAGPGKGICRGAQQSEQSLGSQQQEKPYGQTEHHGHRRAHCGDLVTGPPGLAGADVLSQQDSGGGAHGLQHDDDHVHHLVAVADGGHGGGPEVGDHELIHVAYQELQQQLCKDGQGEAEDPAGLGGGGECHGRRLLFSSEKRLLFLEESIAA